MRITEKDLKGQCDRLNRITNSPMNPYEKNADGKYVAQIGCYHLDFAYGGVELVRIVNNGGGVICPLRTGHVTKKELYNRISAYLMGLEESKEVSQ